MKQELTKEEKAYIVYIFEKYRPNEPIAFRIVNKLEELK